MCCYFTLEQRPTKSQRRTCALDILKFINILMFFMYLKVCTLLSLRLLVHHFGPGLSIYWIKCYTDIDVPQRMNEPKFSVIHRPYSHCNQEHSMKNDPAFELLTLRMTSGANGRCVNTDMNGPLTMHHKI